MSRSTPSTAAAAADPAPVWSNGELIVLLAVTAFAGVVRMWHLEQWSLSPIEGESWAAAVSMRGDGWEPVSSLSSRLLQFLLTTGLLPSHGEGWLRLPFAFVGIVTVPLLALVGEGLVGRRAALLAAAVLAVHPAHVLWSQSIGSAGIACAVTVLGVGLCQWLPPRLRWLGLVSIAAGFATAPWAGDDGALITGLRPALLAVAAAGAWSWREAGRAAAGAPPERRLLPWVAFVPVLLLSLLGLVWNVAWGAAAAALPALVWFAGYGLRVWTRRLYEAVLRWQPDALPWAAAVPAGLLGALLFADAGIATLLGATVHGGHRADARGAAACVLRAAATGASEVRAGELLPSLAYYLQSSSLELQSYSLGSARPTPPRDGDAPVAGLRLVPLPLPGVDGTGAVGAAALAQFFVLTAGEVAVRPVDPHLELLQVFALPPGPRDRTVLVWRRRSE